MELYRYKSVCHTELRATRPLHGLNSGPIERGVSCDIIVRQAKGYGDVVSLYQIYTTDGEYITTLGEGEYAYHFYTLNEIRDIKINNLLE